MNDDPQTQKTRPGLLVLLVFVLCEHMQHGKSWEELCISVQSPTKWLHGWEMPNYQLFNFFFYCACSFQALLGQSTAHIWFPSLSNILFRLPNCFQDHVSAPISFHMHFTRIACYATNISISNFHFCRANKQTKQGHTTLLSLSHSLYFVILFLLFQCLSATNIKAVLGECTVSAGYRGNGSNREPGREVKVDLKDSQTK